MNYFFVVYSFRGEKKEIEYIRWWWVYVFRNLSW